MRSRREVGRRRTRMGGGRRRTRMRGGGRRTRMRGEVGRSKTGSGELLRLYQGTFIVIYKGLDFRDYCTEFRQGIFIQW